jgi:hypothetical protein
MKHDHLFDDDVAQDTFAEKKSKKQKKWERKRPADENGFEPPERE